MDKIVHIGNLYGPDRGTGYAGNIWGKQGLAPALTTMGGGMREPMIVETMEIGNIYPSNGQNGAIYTTGDLSPAILSGQGQKGRGIGSCNSPKVVVYEDRRDDMPEQQG